MPCWWGWWQPRWWGSPALAMGGPRGLCLAGRSVKAGLGPRCAGLVGGLQQGTVCLGGLLAWKCTAGDEQTGEKRWALSPPLGGATAFYPECGGRGGVGETPCVPAIAAGEVAEQGPPTGGSAGCGGQELAVHLVLSAQDSGGATCLPLLVGAWEGKGGLGSQRSCHQGELSPWGGGYVPAQPGAGPRCCLPSAHLRGPFQCCWRRAGAEAGQAC